MKNVVEKERIAIGFDFRLFVFGSLIGLILVGVGAFVIWLIGGVNFVLTNSANLIPQVALFLLVSFSEEIVCRAYLLPNIMTKLSPWNSILISSIIFGLFHIFNNDISWTGFLNITLSGILLSMLYLKRRDLSIPSGLHFAWNFIQGPILGFAVSGQKSTLSLFTVHKLSNNDIITGGEFGIEGSLIISLILLLAIWIFHDSIENNSLKIAEIK
jgi:hypothetical protein